MRPTGFKRQAFELGWLSREPYQSWLSPFCRRVAELSGWPIPEEYDALVRAARVDSDAVTLPGFVRYDARQLRAAGGYERYVAARACVPSRPHSWHDFFNMAVWAHLPRLRWALNALHAQADPRLVDPRNGRTPVQNVAAQFDESGLIVASSDPGLLAELAELAFKRVFWERRVSLAASTRFIVVGHGSLEALLEPHLGLTGKALFLSLRSPPAGDPLELFDRVDRLAAREVERWRHSHSPVALNPVPLLGVPGWHPDQNAAFYDNARYFRSVRQRPTLFPAVTARE